MERVDSVGWDLPREALGWENWLGVTLEEEAKDDGVKEKAEKGKVRWVETRDFGVECRLFTLSTADTGVVFGDAATAAE